MEHRALRTSGETPLIGERYRIEGTLGRGGMAVVYQVLDTSANERLALKRLDTAASGDREDDIALFEREFLTLAQLVHPRIVTAYDYGLDELGPYYTMELLDGGDLQRLAPVQWRRACALARDVCSALSLLHSRRMVYRDLSPRNVRSTSDGLAKLIDFGAMSPMGPSRQLVGTLPSCAPEAVHSLHLDARTDLYALGATLYYTLVGRHAYPARSVSQLFDLWRSPPVRPSELVSDIPDALDALVLELLHVDASLRPGSAAEVMERLSAIASLTLDEQLLVSQAYLSAPTLVGRDPQLDQLRKAVSRANRGRGASLLIQGRAGLGCSRLLGAAVLEAKLAGTVVLQADAGDALGGHYGVVRALAAQLIAAAPDVALPAAKSGLKLLGHVIPELLQATGPTELQVIEVPQQLGSRVQPALRHWFSEVSGKRPLLIAIDDVQRADEPSLAFITLLAQEVGQQALAIVATTDPTATAPGPVQAAMKVLGDASAPVLVPPLDLEHTAQLLSSVFGDVPNLHALATRLHAISDGNARDIMRLAQHLVDSGVIRYRAGAWSLPERIETADVPSSMAQALRARIAKLGNDARELARSMALEPSERFSFDDCLLLSEHGRAAVLSSLDELLAADVVRALGPAYTLGLQGWVTVLTTDMELGERQRAHARLARLFERRGDGLRCAKHLLSAGEPGRGLDVLVAHAERSQKLTDEDPKAFEEMLQAVPGDWLEVYEHGLRLCDELGRPPRQAYHLRARVQGMYMIAIHQADTAPLLAARIEQLRRDSGLDIYAQLGDGLPAAERLAKTFATAGERYASSPESERVLDPKTAVQQLAKALVTAIGLIVYTYDYAFLKKLPSLAPYAPLSPSLALVAQLVQGVELRMTSRTDEALAIYGKTLERLAQPDGAGLDASYRLHTRLRILATVGALEAAMGLSSSLQHAAELEAEPLYETNALMIRMLHHLWQGDAAEADRYKRQVEVLRIQNASRQSFESQHLLWELTAHALVDDLTRVKRAIEATEPLGAIHEGWRVVLEYGRGEYQRIRGDFASALEHLDAALDRTGPGRHEVWASLAGARIRTLFELGRYAEAEADALAYLAAAAEKRIAYTHNYIRLPLSLVQSKLGKHEAAAATATAVIDGFLALGTTGLNLAIAYETRARVAREAGDQAAFARYAEACERQLPQNHNRLLVAKYERLLQNAGPTNIAFADTDDHSFRTHVTSVLERCRDPAERARRGLDMLARQCGAVGGVLYTRRATGLVRTGQVGRFAPGQALDAWAEQYFSSEGVDRDATQSIALTPEMAESNVEWRGEGPERYIPVLLSHYDDRGLALTGLAVLAVEPNCRFVYPSRLALELSRFAARSEDALPVYV